MDHRDIDYRHYQRDERVEEADIDERWHDWHTSHHLQVAFNRRSA